MTWATTDIAPQAPAGLHPGAPVLQRKCACGGTPGPSGKCEECRKKRLQGQADIPPSRPLLAGAQSFANPLQAHAPAAGRGTSSLPAVPARLAFAQPRATDDPTANERDFKRDGRVETVRPGEYLLWNFDIGQDKLKPEHKAELKRIAGEINGVLSQNKEWQVDVEGEASPSGNDKINDALSARRADNVQKALVTAGVDSARIKVTSTGSRRALPDVTSENMARSRGVRIILAPRLDPSAAAVAPAALQTGGQNTGSSACPVNGSAMTLMGGPVTEDRGSGQYAIVAGSGPASPGMLLTGVASIGTAGCGSLEFVQNVQPFRQIIFKDGSRLTMSSTSWALDTSDPYPSQPMQTGSPTSLAALANDNPVLGSGNLGNDLDFTEGLINTMEIRDVFRMFMLLRLNGGVRQALQMGTWTFIGLATSPSTSLAPKTAPPLKLKLDSTVSRILPSQGSATPTSQAPVLTPNVTSVPFQLDTAGLTGDKIFAKLFFPIFQKGAPLPKGKP